MNTTAIKSALSYPKAKRGDVVAVELTSSYTNAKLKTVKITHYYLAKATKVSGGLVKAYRKASGAEGIVDTRHRVMVISGSDVQGAARDLFDTELGAMDFDSIDQVKDAIRSRVEALS